MKTYNNLIITAANSAYYESLLTLISSIHKFGLNIIDKIIVYNLGLDDLEIRTLNGLKKVKVVDFTENEKNLHPIFMEGKQHVYKCYCLLESSKLSNNVFWIDSGAMFINNFSIIFELIENDEIFMVGDYHLNNKYTSEKCSRIINANDKELNSYQLSSGMIGFKSEGKYKKLFEEAKYYSLIPGCCDGDENNHRHDQSILSILSSRYDCPRQNLDIFGYWTDHNRNLNKALEMNSVIFVHRRGHYDKTNLIYED